MRKPADYGMGKCPRGGLTMANYTKGEWKASYQYPHHVYVTDGNRPPIVAPIADMTALNSEKESNANLIAAAPDMYEALKGIQYLCVGYAELPKELIKTKINEALAKAEGRT